VGPHGALELPAIVFAGAAGLVAGQALWLPGRLSRGAALRRALPSLWAMLLGAALILVVAGLIEGVLLADDGEGGAHALKVGAAGALFAALVVYLFVTRRGEPEHRAPPRAGGAHPRARQAAAGAGGARQPISRQRRRDMDTTWSVSAVLASLEKQAAFLREREAFHVGHEAHHREQRSGYAAELAEIDRRLEAFCPAAAEATQEP
jgi:stage II sporulation SpoM-like protein